MNHKVLRTTFCDENNSYATNYLKGQNIIGSLNENWAKEINSEKTSLISTAKDKK